MSNVWRVLWYEYLRHVRRKRFILVVLSMPLLLLVIIAVGFLSVILQFNSTPVGYVDHAGLLRQPSASLEGEGPFSAVQFISFADEQAASAALDAGEIQAYYVVEADYLESGQVRLLANEQPGENIGPAFSKFLQASLIQTQPTAIARRLIKGDEVEVRSLDGERSLEEGQWLQMILPIVAGIFFMIIVNISGGYLLQAVVEEKENRTMEIVVTSISPGELMAGKIIGNLGVGLTQLVIWLSFPLIAFLFFNDMLPFLQDLRIEPLFVWLVLLTLIPAFVLVAALMATIGATATETREAQQIAGMFTLPIAVPFWFTNSIMTNPNGPLAMGMSLFPLTAPVALPLRASFAVVPVWQMALSVGLLIASAAGALWLSGRAFRLGMLRYGKRVTWKELVGAK